MSNRLFDAVPDHKDARDWVYRPTLNALPPTIDHRKQVPLILDQGREGACTGFALAAVVNFLVQKLHGAVPGTSGIDGVSPRMLYELARRYDEWPGERYEGSSARGAMKGWITHGVALRHQWPDECKGMRHFTRLIEEEAQEQPGGAYYRIDKKQTRDVHAALAETGIVYATVMVHRGWNDVPTKRNGHLPVVTMHEEIMGGHAIALVGYNEQGFVFQNSWGKDWGGGGFALLSYEDFEANVTDLWVAQMGVPIQRPHLQRNKIRSASLSQWAKAQKPSLNEIRDHIVNIGNNGFYSDSGDYWSTEEDVARLFDPMNGPLKQSGCNKLMLYMHGGLNSEEACAKRVLAMSPTMLANGIYPIHLMWETGAFETMRSMIKDKLGDKDDVRAQGFLGDTRDYIFESTLGKAAKSLWDEMKENAQLASTVDRHDRPRALRHSLQLIQQYAKENAIELHVVTHSAGSILFAHALHDMVDKKLPLKSVQMLAPAVSIERFLIDVLPKVENKQCPVPRLYLLTDKQEQDDCVGKEWIYGKSLLYLVSNAMESKRGKPLLGMEAGLRSEQKLNALYWKGVQANERTLVLSGITNECKSSTHGGFDNDANTMNSVLNEVLGKFPDPSYTPHTLSDS